MIDVCIRGEKEKEKERPKVEFWLEKQDRELVLKADTEGKISGWNILIIKPSGHLKKVGSVSCEGIQTDGAGEIMELEADKTEEGLKRLVQQLIQALKRRTYGVLNGSEQALVNIAKQAIDKD